VLGTQKLIKTLYGDMDIAIPRGTQDGDMKVLRNYGVFSSQKKAILKGINMSLISWWFRLRYLVVR